MLNSRAGRRRRRPNAEGDCATCLINTGCWREPPREPRIVRTERVAPLAVGASLPSNTAQEELWLVRSGALKLVRLNRDGTETIIDFRGRGELVASARAISRGPMMQITALTEATVCRLLPPDHANSVALAQYWRLVAEASCQQWERALEPWSSLPAVERVAHFLAAWSQRAEHEQHDGSFDLPMTRAELGSRLGLTEETVCRALRKLHLAKRIQLAGRRVRILQEVS